MGDERFAIRREDGRSNSQVVIDLVKEATPGTIFAYEKIADALSDGTDRQFDVPAVRYSVLGAVSMLEKLHKRTLLNVRSIGYKLARAEEHMLIAGVRSDRANRQLRKGLSTLTHVKWDEMDDNTRRAHEGQLLIMSAFYQQNVAMDRRMRKMEETIKALVTPKN